VKWPIEYKVNSHILKELMNVEKSIQSQIFYLISPHIAP
jgi:hypothetical protein